LPGVVFACLAGFFFGALNITMRFGLARTRDVAAGSAVIASIALVLVGVTALVAGSALRPGDLWPFVLVGALVPGLSQVLVVHAVRAAGASRAGILFGMSPLFSSVIAIAAFGEPLRWPLVAGTLLVVSGGITLAWEGERPADYRVVGAVLAVTVAVMFGARDNISRAVIKDVSSGALSQASAVMLGASLVLVPNLLRQGAAAATRFRAALPAFAPSAIVTALAQVFLFEALDRARVTVTAPLMGTGVLWTVVLASIFLGHSELVGRRLYVVALLVVAGGGLVAATH
jgi:drug/metabolite transporter (DMT)-like permease